MKPFTSSICTWVIRNAKNEWDKKSNRFGVPIDHVVDYNVAVKFEQLVLTEKDRYEVQFRIIQHTFEYLLSKRIVSECSRDELVKLEGLGLEKFE